MSGLNQLKERIYDEGMVGKLLEELGCDCIELKSGRSSDDLVTARLPDYPNKRAIQIYLSPQLNSSIVTCGISGDIYSVVGFILYGCESFDEVKTHLYQIKTFICNALDYQDILNQPYDKSEPTVDWNWWLRPIQKERVKEIEVVENPILDEVVLDEFIHYPWEDWHTKEGISIEAQKMFGIGFHVLSERITIPIHNKYGQLIGVKGRLSYDSDTIPKYSYIYPCSKSIELFNLHRALPHVLERKEIIVVEGAKTAIKLYSWNIKNVVSIEGDRLNPAQVKLIKETGLEVDIIFAYDKDKNEEFIKNQIKQIKNRRVHYFYDIENRLEGKDSPTDKGIEVYLDLYQNKLLYK